MAGFEHLDPIPTTSAIELDEIASADPPAYLRRCFAEGIVRARIVAGVRVQQLAVCVDGTRLPSSMTETTSPWSRELIADWRAHYEPALCA